MQNLNDLQNQVLAEDEFLDSESVTFGREAVRGAMNCCLGELEELIRENRWEDALDLAWPVEEKLPELVAVGLDVEIRAKAGFILGQLQRFDDAVAELTVCVKKDPLNHRYHSSLAYTAYNSLFAAKNREIFLSGRPRQERQELAHAHFRKAQELNPDGVTSFYREAMLYRKLENKPREALSLFRKAVDNWDALTEDEKKRRHQERKNWIKSLYNLASTMLELGQGRKALAVLQRCIEADDGTSYVSDIFKYFALGKIHYQLGRFKDAREALEASAALADRQPKDFVYELLARTELALGRPRNALQAIMKTPEKKRRAYYRWTEADVCCALGDYARARAVLNDCQERDNRSRHKALIRLARIEYRLGDYALALASAEQADGFFRERFGNPCADALFWKAVCLLRLGRIKEAGAQALELHQRNPNYPKLDRLLNHLDARAPREDEG